MHSQQFNNWRVLPLDTHDKIAPSGLVLLTSTVASHPFSARYLTILFARVLNADHCLHASIVTRFPPPPEEAVVFFGDFLLATAFAFVPDAFLALLAAVAARDFAMVLLSALLKWRSIHKGRGG